MEPWLAKFWLVTKVMRASIKGVSVKWVSLNLDSSFRMERVAFLISRRDGFPRWRDEVKLMHSSAVAMAEVWSATRFLKSI